MSLNLNDIYRDVYSQLGVSGNEHDVSSQDIIRAINDSIRFIRVEYVNNGLAHYFTVEDTINTFSTDSYFPFLKVGTLGNRIMSEVPEEIAVIASNIKITSNTIENTTQTFSEGDIAEYNGELYEAIRDITAENTFGETFDSRDLRMFYPDNGLKYFAGDIVFNSSDEKYYKVTTDFVAEGGTSELDEVVWRKVGNANKAANHYPLRDLRHISLHGDETQAFSIVNNKIYITPIVSEVNVLYVPEWTDVTDLATAVEIPDAMISQVIEMSRVKLLSKLARQPIEDND